MLYYPKSIIYKQDQMKTKGLYKKTRPIGAIIHTTAGSQNQTYQEAIDWAIKESICSYLVIDRAGLVAQSTPFNKWGSHAGASFWPGANNITGVSQYFLGIELICPGLLKKTGGNYYTSFNKKIDDINQVRLDKKGRAFFKLSIEQENSLVELLNYLEREFRQYGFSFSNIFGHDEVCEPLGRKSDPGASLSMTMPEFRSKLLKEWLIKP